MGTNEQAIDRTSVEFVLNHHLDLLAINSVRWYGQDFHLKNKTAVVTPGIGRITFKELNERINRWGRALMTLGLKRGDKCLLMMSNCIEIPEIMLGCSAIGVAIVPVSAKFNSGELTYVANFSDATAIIFNKDCRKVVEDSMANFEKVVNFVYLGEENETPDYASNYKVITGKESPETVDVFVDEDDIFWMGFTGGTTGNPKATLITQRTIVQNWIQMVYGYELSRHDSVMVASPMNHGLGICWGLCALDMGQTLVIMEGFDPAKVMETIEKEHVTITPLVPAMYAQMMQLENFYSYDTSSLRYLLALGSALSAPAKAEMLEKFPSAGIWEVYSATEASWYCTLRPEDATRKVRSVGLPFFQTYVKLMDDDGNEVPQGEVGEFRKIGNLLGASYYKNEEATQALYKNGWCGVGDLGRMDEEGFFYVVDRKKDMIVTGAINVYPKEIEDTILMLPGVSEVMVIGVPSKRWGEEIKALVVKKPGAEVTEEDVIDIVKKNLASYKKPRSVEFREFIPKTSNGKPDKKTARKPYWEGTEFKV